jgi:hypothetical protein
MVVSPQPVPPGGTFTVKSASGPLPNTIDCTISANGVKLQQNVLNTSGDVRLVLKDEFGAMQLEGCGALSCKKNINFNVEIANIGKVPMTITAADLELNDSVLSLLGSLVANPLPSGTKTGLGVAVEVGICDGGNFQSQINVEASPSNGSKCRGSDEITFSVSPLPPTPPSPATAPVPVALPTMPVSAPIPAPAPAPTPVSSPIAPPVPVALPTAPIPTPARDPAPTPIVAPAPAALPTAPKQAPVTIPSLAPMGAPVPVALPTAPMLAPVPASAPAPVPLAAPVPVKLPTSPASTPTIASSPVSTPATSPIPAPSQTGFCRANIGISCLTESGQQCNSVRSDLSCAQRLIYGVKITNSGEVSFDITGGKFTLGSFSTGVMSLLSDKSLNPTESTTLQQTVNLNICDVTQLCAAVEIQTAATTGTVCEFVGTDCLTVSSLSPGETKVTSTGETESPFGIDVSCTFSTSESGDSLPCGSPDAVIHRCVERPTTATMMLTGTGCSLSTNGQPLNFTCEDANDGPVMSTGDEVFVLVTDVSEQETTYFSGPVTVGEPFVLQNSGSQLAPNVCMNVYKPDRTTMLQSVKIDSSSSLELGSKYGAAQLIQFSNTKQGNVSHIATFDMRAIITVPGTASDGNVKLTSLTADTNFAGVVDLTPQIAGKVLPPGGSVEVTLQGTADLLERQVYTSLFTIVGEHGQSGSECTGIATLTFESGIPV